jgi:hypothetical protein
MTAWVNPAEHDLNTTDEWAARGDAGATTGEAPTSPRTTIPLRIERRKVTFLDELEAGVVCIDPGRDVLERAGITVAPCTYWRRRRLRRVMS